MPLALEKSLPAWFGESKSQISSRPQIQFLSSNSACFALAAMGSFHLFPSSD